MEREIIYSVSVKIGPFIRAVDFIKSHKWLHHFVSNNRSWTIPLLRKMFMRVKTSKG